MFAKGLFYLDLLPPALLKNGFGFASYSIDWDKFEFKGDGRGVSKLEVY